MRNIVEAARTVLAGKDLHKRYWGEAANTAVYIINRTGTSTVENKTPFELWFNKSYDPKSLNAVFGSDVWVHVPKQLRKKWDMKSKKGIFVGFGENTKGYKIHLPDTDKVTLERDVVFVPEKEGEQYEYEGSDLSQIQTEEMDDIEQEQTEVQNNELDQEDDTPKQQQTVMQLRPRENLRKPYRYSDYAMAYFGAIDVDEPENYEDAMKSRHSTEWNKAIERELLALKRQ
jgi:hypothetical protein